MSQALQKLEGIVNSLPASELDDPSSPNFLNQAARKHLKPSTAKPASKGALFKSRSMLKERVEEIEQAKGVPVGSTVTRIRGKNRATTIHPTRLDFAAALAELEAVAAHARRNPSPASLRRVEHAAKSTAKNLSAKRAEDREAAKNARPETPNLNTFTNLSGPQAATYYKANRSAIHSEQTALALWQQRQDSK